VRSAAPTASAAAPTDDYAARVARVLKTTPLIDGHNDLPWEIRDRFKGDLAAIDLNADTSKLPFPADGAALMTDIPRRHGPRHLGSRAS
jgi:membrane dipeptidase